MYLLCMKKRERNEENRCHEFCCYEIMSIEEEEVPSSAAWRHGRPARLCFAAPRAMSVHEV